MVVKADRLKNKNENDRLIICNITDIQGLNTKKLTHKNMYNMYFCKYDELLFLS